MRHLLWNGRIGMLAAVALWLGSCGGADDSVVPTPGAITRVEVIPDVLSLTEGATQELDASAFDGAGQAVAGVSYTWESSDNAIATVSPSGEVTGVAPGTATITVTAGAISASAHVTVLEPAEGNTIDVLPQITYQTMKGWMGADQLGQFECNPTAYNTYKSQVVDRLVNELGINRVAVGIHSGTEHSLDNYDRLVKGQITYDQWRSLRYAPQNDNDDPFSANPAGFKWTKLDYDIEHVVLPLRQRLAARGEQLYVELLFVDFSNENHSFLQMRNAEEYAEFITEAFKHIQQKYGFAPDGLELLLEPENTPHRPPQLGPALVAAGDRLKAAGFRPDIAAPSTTSMAQAVPYYDGMLQTPRVLEYLTDLSYHRYAGVSDAALQLIAQRAQRDNIRTGMLEWMGAGFDVLWRDLTVGRNSTWMQYALAYCGNQDNPGDGSVYYQVNQASPSAPKINITNDSKYFRQLFLFVRLNAVRIGASTGNASLLEPLAFRNANGSFVVVVRAKGSASFSIRGLPAGTYGIMYTTGTQQWGLTHPDVTLGAGGVLNTNIPAAGVITIYGR